MELSKEEQHILLHSLGIENIEFYVIDYELKLNESKLKNL